MCIRTGSMLLHTVLWLISEDISLLKLVDLHLLKGDNKKTDVNFLGTCFLRVQPINKRLYGITRGRTSPGFGSKAQAHVK